MSIVDRFLSKYLKDLGVMTSTDLTKEEKETYEKYKKTLEESVEDMTLEKVEALTNDLIKILEVELLNYENPREKDLFLKARLRNLKDLLAFIYLPETRKKYMEGEIKGRE